MANKPKRKPQTGGSQVSVGQDNLASSNPDIAEDVELLHSMGYAQELSRRMRGFSNFAISFSIICILSGGINSLAQATAGVGGAAIGIGWPIGCLISFIFALGMAQIASAYPTAGGLYHWGSILGGRGWGWATAWFNLIGLVTVLAAINVGTYYFFMGAFGIAMGIPDNYASKVIFVLIITVLQALINYMGIDLTSKLTDFSGYLIFAVSILLTVLLFAFAPSYDFGRLFTFTNYSGVANGAVWPQADSTLYVFLLGLLLPIYTITGFDASAHTSEETIKAATVVPRGIISSVLWSSLFGWLMLIAFVIATPDMNIAAEQGWTVFFYTMDAVMPNTIKQILYLGILLAQFLCGLATVTSSSRMIFAFARDGGLPGSAWLRKVHDTYLTPGNAIWAATAFCIIFTAITGLLTAQLYTTIVAVCVIFLFISYGVPIVLGALAYGNTWKQMGPFNLGGLYRVIALLCALAVIFIFYIGIQSPNDQALPIAIVFLVVTALVWFGVERKRFEGPPTGERLARRQRELAGVTAGKGKR